MAASLVAALALVCAFAHPQCAAVPTVTIVSADIVPFAPVTAFGAFTTTTRTITVKPGADDTVTAAELVHELTHVIQANAGWRFTTATDDCLAREREAFMAQSTFWADAHGGDPVFGPSPAWADMSARLECRQH